MSEQGLKNAMSVWFEDHIKCIVHPIEEFKRPYSAEQMVRMMVPCGQLKLLYDLIDRFEIDIPYQVYDRYKEFADFN